ncbi:MAG: ATP-binding protein [Bacteroidota bacterium]|nr:ATP-binding protein [Bacteroidota bacterium]
MKHSSLNIKNIFYIFLFVFFAANLFSQDSDLKKIEDLSQRSFLKKNYDSSLIFADRLLTAAKEKGSNYYQVSAIFRKGSVFAQLNKEKEAADLFYEALNLCNDTTEDFLKASIYNELGILSYHRNNPTIAKSYYREEIKIRRAMKDDYRVANCLINLCTMHRRLGEIDSSALLLKQVRILAGKINDRQLSAHYLQSQGAQWQTLNNLDSAAIYYIKALDIWKKENNKRDEMIPLFNLGLIYHLKNDFNKALETYLEVEKITNQHKLESYKLTLYGNLAEVYYDLKDYKRSAEYFRKHIETNNANQKKEISEYTAKLDRQFKIEKNEIINKQKEEIEVQTLKIEEQNRRIYLSILSAFVIAGILIVLLFYYNFKKRLNTKIEEAKKKFFSNVVHEIRTPLSMIQAPLTVLKKKLSSTDDQQNIELAERNIKRLNELVNQMLDISKIDSVKYKLNETFGDIELFYDQLLTTYTKIAIEKNINLLHNFVIPNKVAFFDKDSLEKITGNLLSNAIKYTANNNQVGIDVFTEENEHGIKLTINVWDTGVGISQKDQENIFDRFYRSDKTATSTKGVGIGLSLVKELVDLHHGTISVKSKEGKGSTFTVTLDLKTKDDVAIIKQNTTSLSADDHIYQILLVEDDKDILDFNANFLEQNKFKVLKATNGKEAVELLEKTLTDLIISDLMMPELDGIGLLKAVKNNAQYNHIPVIILSAKASPESRMEALRSGAQGYLPKPFLPDELLSLVVNQLEILSKRKTEFKELIAQPEKKVEEKFVGTEPYTQKLFSLIFKQLEDSELSVEKLADQMATNRSHFQRKVKAITGLSPSEIIKTIRLEKANELLLSKNGNITEVAYQTGFSSQSYFTKCYTQHFGLSPTQTLQKNK